MYPPTKGVLKHIRRNLKETGEYIDLLGDRFRKHFERYRRLKDVIEGLSDNHKSNKQIMRTFSAEIKGVSDSIIVAVPLENQTDNLIPINNILATLQGVCLLYNIALAEHKPIRGGIDAG